MIDNRRSKDQAPDYGLIHEESIRIWNQDHLIRSHCTGDDGIDSHWYDLLVDSSFS